jgi:hypothetical protein
VGDAVGGRTIGAGGTAEQAAAKVARYHARAELHRQRGAQIEALVRPEPEPQPELQPQPEPQPEPEPTDIDLNELD